MTNDASALMAPQHGLFTLCFLSIDCRFFCRARFFILFPFEIGQEISVPDQPRYSVRNKRKSVRRQEEVYSVLRVPAVQPRLQVYLVRPRPQLSVRTPVLVHSDRRAMLVWLEDYSARVSRPEARHPARCSGNRIRPLLLYSALRRVSIAFTFNFETLLVTVFNKVLPGSTMTSSCLPFVRQFFLFWSRVVRGRGKATIAFFYPFFRRKYLAVGYSIRASLN